MALRPNFLEGESLGYDDEVANEATDPRGRVRPCL